MFSKSPRVFITALLLILLLNFIPAMAETTDEMFEKGLTYLDQGEYEKAIECFDRAIELDSENAGAWYKKGIAIYKSGGSMEDELYCYDKALEIKTNKYQAEAIYAKGWVLYDQGKLEEALECYSNAQYWGYGNADYNWYGEKIPDETVEFAAELIKAGDFAGFKALLDKEPDLVFIYFPVYDETSNITLLHYSALQGEKAITELLITRGANIHSMSTPFGYTPLHCATGNGHLDIVKLLISAGADVNKGKGGFVGTPLHEAVTDGDIEIVEYLIEKGADVNALDRFGGNPLNDAISSLHDQFRRREIPEDALEIVKLLISKGSDVNNIGNENSTPLIKAVVADDLEVAELLLENGADFNAPTWGKTPLDMAVSDEMKELLKKYGAKSIDEL